MPIYRVRPGMVLAEDVARGQESMLLTKGTKLMAEQIEMLRLRGVEIVTIDLEGEAEPEPSPAATPEQLKQIVLEQHRWFGDTRSDPVMNEVFRSVVARLARPGGR